MCRNHLGPIDCQCQRDDYSPKTGFYSLTIYIEWIGDGQPWIDGRKGRRFAMATGDGFHLRMRKEIMDTGVTIGDLLERNTLMDTVFDNGSSAACTMSLWWSVMVGGRRLTWCVGIADVDGWRCPPKQ